MQIFLLRLINLLCINIFFRILIFYHFCIIFPYLLNELLIIYSQLSSSIFYLFLSAIYLVIVLQLCGARTLVDLFSCGFVRAEKFGMHLINNSACGEALDSVCIRRLLIYIVNFPE